MILGNLSSALVPLATEQEPDAIVQTNSSVVADASAMAMGLTYQTTAHSTGIMFGNAVNTQNQQNILGQAALTQGVAAISRLDLISDAVAIAKVLESGANP
jgi:hypothetical protein